MNREEAKLFYIGAVRVCVLAALFSPLVLLSEFYFPYIVPKTIFFQFLVEGALFFWILLAALDRKYAPRFDLLSKAVLGFFAAYALAAALGANPARSFLGTYERMLSVVNLAHFVALFFIARAVFVERKDWLLLFRTFICASMLVSLYGLGQKLGFSSFYHAGIDRIDSTIGNAAFVGGYLIFAVFFALALLVREARSPWRWLYLCSIALNLVIIYFTGTRGAALGLAAGGFFFACRLCGKARSGGRYREKIYALGRSCAYVSGGCYWRA